ncbi:MAG: hypothetical protein FVQ85_04355 [Planctomycetes bacterium]|nr:hypothetical protein [Planctomycetota bacterium]
MAVKLIGKQICKKYVVVFICLLIIGNLAQGTVLCFGADGHIELEYAFHKCCDHPVHSCASEQNQLSSEPGHEKGRHCEPCVDVPFFFGLAKITCMPEKIIATLLATATNVIFVAEKPSFSAYNSISNTLKTTSYFTPLRTVILLV